MCHIYMVNEFSSGRQGDSNMTVTVTLRTAQGPCMALAPPPSQSRCLVHIHGPYIPPAPAGVLLLAWAVTWSLQRLWSLFQAEGQLG